MGVLEDIGGKIEPYVEPPKSGNDEAIRELLENQKRLTMLLAKNPIAPPWQEKPSKPKVEEEIYTVPSVPALSQKLGEYPVYFVLPVNEAYHIKITKYKKDTKLYYYCPLNHVTYTAHGFEGGELLISGKTTPVMLLQDGRLAVARVEFTEKAKNYIAKRDNMTRKDRAAESAVRTQDKKYLGIDGMNIIIAMLMISIGVFLVLWVWFGGMPGIIGAINAGASAMQQPINQTVVNQTIVVR